MVSALRYSLLTVYGKDRMEHVIVKNIKALRAVLKITQGTFADKIGASTGLISNIENGKRPVTANLVASICAAYGFDEHTILATDMLADAVESTAREAETAPAPSEAAARSDCE